MSEPAEGGNQGAAIEPVDLLIREPIGELVLTLNKDKLVVAPSRAFIHTIAERMGRAEALVRSRSEMVGPWIARAREAAESRLQQLFGEFGVQECEVELKESRLHVRVRKVRTSFGPQAFDLRQAESFVRQFKSAKTGSDSNSC